MSQFNWQQADINLASRPAKELWLECLKRAKGSRGDRLEAYSHAVNAFVANVEMAAAGTPIMQTALRQQTERLMELEDISRPQLALEE